MNFSDFESLDEKYRRVKPSLFRLSPAQNAKMEWIDEVENELNTTLPAIYKDFLKKYGGGYFGFLTLYSVDPENEFFILRQREKFKKYVPEGFIPFEDDHAGGYHGFLSTNGLCSDEVYYWNFDGGIQSKDQKFLDFVARFAYEA